MSVIVVGMSTLASFFKLLLCLIVFILILAASYYFTKWYANSGFIRSQSQNIQMVESFSMGPGKQICILRIGEKYIAVALCKEQITFLTQLDEEELSLTVPETSDASFREIFGDMVKERLHGGSRDKEK